MNTTDQPFWMYGLILILLAAGGFGYYSLDQQLRMGRSREIQLQARIDKLDSAGDQLVLSCRHFDSVLKGE